MSAVGNSLPRAKSSMNKSTRDTLALAEKNEEGRWAHYTYNGPMLSIERYLGLEDPDFFKLIGYFSLRSRVHNIISIYNYQMFNLV